MWWEDGEGPIVSLYNDGRVIFPILHQVRVDMRSYRGGMYSTCGHYLKKDAWFPLHYLLGGVLGAQAINSTLLLLNKNTGLAWKKNPAPGVT